MNIFFAGEGGGGVNTIFTVGIIFGDTTKLDYFWIVLANVQNELFCCCFLWRGGGGGRVLHWLISNIFLALPDNFEAGSS